MTKRESLVIFLGLTLIFSPMYSQVTIGADKKPENFSVLELISHGNLGLRLPQMSEEKRNTMEATNEFQAEKLDRAVGLTIFNISNKCVEIWNSLQWISWCQKFGIEVNPNPIWLSPSPGNSAKQVQVTSFYGPWVLDGPQPTNAVISPTNGDEGTTNITVTRSSTVFGLSSFNIKNTITGDILTVNVDNYYIDGPQTLGLTNNAGLNTALFDITVFGGNETFTVVQSSIPSWITSATIVNGQLQLSANQSPDKLPRVGSTITLAHGSDPTYQITLNIIQTALPPFDFLVLKYTWNLSSGGDLDIAVEVRNPDDPTNSIPPTIPFANDPYTPGGFSDLGINDIQRAVGWANWRGIFLNGGEGVNSATSVADNSTLLIWGGDARDGEGETVFLKAPLITPNDPLNDNQNLPRHINIDAYAGWFAGILGEPVRLTIYTYTGGTMLKPSSKNITKPVANQNPWINEYNFYNVLVGTTNTDLLSENAWDYLRSPSFSMDKLLVVNKQATYVSQKDYRSSTNGTTRLATIVYDRWTRSANVIWHAAEYNGGLIVPFGPVIHPVVVNGGNKDEINNH